MGVSHHPTFLDIPPSVKHHTTLSVEILITKIFLYGAMHNFLDTETVTKHLMDITKTPKGIA